MTVFERLFERHKNPLSWIVRPAFGILMFYGAWRNSVLLLSLGVVGAATSWFWFPRPRRLRPWVDRFIEVERRYITPPWTAPKVFGLAAVFVFIVVVTVAFWRHDVALGLSIFVLGALAKSIWSVKVAGRAGIPAAIIGIVSAGVAIAILCRRLI